MKSDNRECLIFSGSYGGLMVVNSGYGILLEYKRWILMVFCWIIIRVGMFLIVLLIVIEFWYLLNYWVLCVINLDSRYLLNYIWRILCLYVLIV